MKLLKKIKKAAIGTALCSLLLASPALKAQNMSKPWTYEGYKISQVKKAKTNASHTLALLALGGVVGYNNYKHADRKADRDLGSAVMISTGILSPIFGWKSYKNYDNYKNHKSIVDEHNRELRQNPNLGQYRPDSSKVSRLKHIGTAVLCGVLGSHVASEVYSSRKRDIDGKWGDSTGDSVGYGLFSGCMFYAAGSELWKAIQGK